VKGGLSHGESDDHGYETITGKVHRHPAPARLWSRKAHLPLRWPEHAPDRPLLERGAGDFGV